MNPCPHCGQRSPSGLHGWNVTPAGRVWHCPSIDSAPMSPLTAENIADPPEDRSMTPQMTRALNIKGAAQ